MSNRVRPVFKNEAGRIEYPPVILTSKESKNQAWYNNTDAGGFESTRGEEYKGHNLRDLPSSFIELEKQAAPPATYSFVRNNTLRGPLIATNVITRLTTSSDKPLTRIMMALSSTWRKTKTMDNSLCHMGNGTWVEGFSR